MIRRAIVAIVSVALLAGAVTAFRGNGSIDVPTAVVEEGPFIDYLPARGEIRAERSIVLSAPSGADLQIIEIVANGASVKKGDAVAIFDSTPQQRTREQKQSELAQRPSCGSKTTTASFATKSTARTCGYARPTTWRQRRRLCAACWMRTIAAPAITRSSCPPNCSPSRRAPNGSSTSSWWRWRPSRCSSAASAS